MSLFPRFVQSEFAPMFRLLDDYANHAISTSGRTGGFGPSALSSSLRSFQPKFNVTENKDAYELHGELPGIEQKDINIEFTDPQTLTIKGQTHHVHEEGQPPTGFIEGQAEQGKITEGEGEHYHKPTVEDETQMSGANPDAAKGTEGESTEVTQQQQQQPKQSESRYWIREMSSGSFARTFAFPTRVDQDAVKASLKNGILSIVVPKAAAPQSKRINVE